MLSRELVIPLLRACFFSALCCRRAAVILIVTKASNKHHDCEKYQHEIELKNLVRVVHDSGDEDDGYPDKEKCHSYRSIFHTLYMSSVITLIIASFCLCWQSLIFYIFNEGS